MAAWVRFREQRWVNSYERQGDSLDLPTELLSLLKDCGCSVVDATGVEAVRDTTQANPDLILVNLADIQTADPQRAPRVKKLREQYRKPIVCMLPYPTEQQVPEAAALGADLLIFKPLCAEEFESRIRLLLWEKRPENTYPFIDRRRHSRRKEDRDQAQRRREQRGPYLQVCEREKVVFRDSEPLHLTRKEYVLLCLLASNPSSVFSFEEIIQAVWPSNARATTADVHQGIYALRKKIEPNPHHPRYIISVPSFGYMFAGCSRT